MYEKTFTTYSSVRNKHWNDFSDEVARHIYRYTVQQYGDYPNDQATEFTVEDYRTNLMRYVNRIAKNSRGFEESLRDCLKMAHYAQMLYKKLLETGE